MCLHSSFARLHLMCEYKQLCVGWWCSYGDVSLWKGVSLQQKLNERGVYVIYKNYKGISIKLAKLRVFFFWFFVCVYWEVYEISVNDKYIFVFLSTFSLSVPISLFLLIFLTLQNQFTQIYYKYDFSINISLFWVLLLQGSLPSNITNYVIIY